jgi:hypothetical protein
VGHSAEPADTARVATPDPDEQIELFAALAEAKEAEAENLRDEDCPLDPKIIARLNAEAPARHAYGALHRALEAVLKLEPPGALVAYGYRETGM